MACIRQTIVFFLLLTVSVRSFNPDWTGHKKIVFDALKDFNRTVDGRVIRFSNDVIKDIYTADCDTDYFYFAFPSYHFSNEEFSAASQLIYGAKETAISDMLNSSPDFEAARTRFGRLSHTVQDFYAHSNFVNVSSRAFLPSIGREIIPDPPASMVTCPRNPWTLGAYGLRNLTSGYFQYPVSECSAPAGKCRHGCPVICPQGINRDTPGRPGYTRALACAIAATVDYFNQLLDTPAIARSARLLAGFMGSLQEGAGEEGEGKMTPVIADARFTEQYRAEEPHFFDIRRVPVRGERYALEVTVHGPCSAPRFRLAAGSGAGGVSLRMQLDFEDGRGGGVAVYSGEAPVPPAGRAFALAVICAGVQAPLTRSFASSGVAARFGTPSAGVLLPQGASFVPVRAPAGLTVSAGTAIACAKFSARAVETAADEEDGRYSIRSAVACDPGTEFEWFVRLETADGSDSNTLWRRSVVV